MGASATDVNNLLVVGELCIDLIIDIHGEIRFGQHEQLVQGTTMTMGSSSAITACGAAALGVPTMLVSVRGDDTFGDFLAAELNRRGVDARGVRIDRSVPTGASTHLTRPDGDRAILTSMGSIGAVRADDVADDVLERAAHVHVGSYFLQRELQRDAASLFALARANGATTSLDGNFDPAEKWDAGILEVLPQVDVFFGNEQELCGVTKTHDLGTAIARALQRMPDGGMVVAKLGAKGAVVARCVDGVIKRTHASAPTLEGDLVDTVGAGDTLAAGFISARLGGSGVAEALALAVACGTASTRGAGGVGAQPDRITAERIAATVPVAHCAE